MPSLEERWDEKFAQVLEEEMSLERRGHYEPDQFYVSGRVSKDFPNKEDPAWWRAKGPGFVKSWVNWRNASGLHIATMPDGRPGIELEVWAIRGDLQVQSHIDRVMEDDQGRLYIIDLKSGSQTPSWPLQMALNNLGLLSEYEGLFADFAGFWSARKGAIDPGWSDLRIYDPEWLWEQVRRAREIRDQGLFVAQPTQLCKSACGVKEFCKAVGGPLSLTLECNPHTSTKELG